MFTTLKMNNTKALVAAIIKGIQEKKGKDIVVADLTNIDDSICDFFIICQGNSPAQLEAIVRSIAETAEKDLKEKPVGLDGFRNSEWVAIDYIDVIVHVFLPSVREFYQLENLWADAKLTTIPNLD